MQNRPKNLVSNAVSLGLVAIFGTLATESFADDSDAFSKIVQPAIKQHCASCHGANAKIEGDADLLSVEASNLAEKAELIRRMIDVLDLEEMPPEEEPPLSPELRRRLVTELRVILHDVISKRDRFRKLPFAE